MPFDLRPAWNSLYPFTTLQWCHRLHKLPTKNWRLPEMTSMFHFDMPHSNWTHRYGCWRPLQSVFHEEEELPHRRAFMNIVCVAGHLHPGEKAKNSNRVETAEQLWLQLYFEASPDLLHWDCHVFIVVLGLVENLNAAIVHGRAVVLVDRFDDGYPLLRPTVTSVVACGNWMITAAAFKFGRLSRFGVR